MRKKYDSGKLKFFINLKLKKHFIFFTYILPNDANYVAHELTKEFLKSSHFENITTGFLLRCQNTLRQTTPWNDAFSAMKKKLS